MQDVNVTRDQHQKIPNAIWKDIVDLEERVGKIENQLNETQGTVRSPQDGRKIDARIILDRGSNRTFVITEALSEGDEYLSKIEGIYTFVYAPDFTLERGDVIKACIIDVGDTHAEALAIKRINAGDEQ